jgi:flagellum-specific peptidoglycan hydrolase FlgJ
MNEITISFPSSTINHEPSPHAPPTSQPTPSPSTLDRLMEGCERIPCTSGFARAVSSRSAPSQHAPSTSYTKGASSSPSQTASSSTKLESDSSQAASSSTKLVTTKRTVVSAQSLRDAIVHARPDLPPKAVELLVAQSSLETGRFQHCYNFNLGNVKGKETEPHTHLRNTWEMVSLTQAKAFAQSPQSHLCRFDPPLSTVDSSNRDVQIRVTFQPPHPQTRFRAYATLEEGAKQWLGFINKLSDRHPELEETLREGDPAKYAKALKHAGYFTASTTSYTSALNKHLELVRKEYTP